MGEPGLLQTDEYTEAITSSTNKTPSVVELTNLVASPTSRTDNANCVEVAFVQVAVAVRDSKNSAGPVLTFAAEDWVGFLEER